MLKHLLKTTLLLFALVVGSGNAWADDVSTLTFSSTCGGTGTADDGAKWTVSSDGTESTYDSTKGIHYGTGSAQVKYIQLSTSDISGTITKVVVNASTASGVSATVAVTIGGNAFGGDAKSLTSSASNYTFNGSASGAIVVTVTKPSKAAKAIYVKSVEVTYSNASSTYTVTYDANGASSGTVPTDNTAYSSGATVTVLGNTGSLVKSGYVFDGWNTADNGTGTDRAVGSTFSISANTTLFAKWTAKTITNLSYTGTPTKTSYQGGDSFDPTGLTITATFNDASSEDVTNAVVWTPNPLTAGTTSVTGTFMGQTVVVNDLTVTAAKYAINIDGAITGGTVDADMSEAEEGTTVTLTATPASGYAFDEWNVTDANSVTVTVSGSNTFEMPGCFVNVSATFKQIFHVTYYVSGVENNVDRVDGATLSLDTPANVGTMTFAGWSTSNDKANPVFVANTSAVTSDLTLYAVFIAKPSIYQLVEANQADWRGDYLIAYSSSAFADGRVGGKDGSGIGAQNTKVSLLAYINGKSIPCANGDTYHVTLEAINNEDLSKGYLLKTQDGKYNYQTSNSNGLAATSTRNTAKEYPISIVFMSSSDVRLNLGGSAEGAVFRYNTAGYFRFYKDGGQSAVYLYKKSTPLYSLGEQEIATISAAGVATYVTPADLDFSQTANLRAYKITAENIGENTIELTEITAAPAQTAVILVGDAAGYDLVYATSSVAAITDNQLKASDGTVTGNGSTIYAMSQLNGSVGFRKVADGVTIPAGKAYLELPAASVKSFYTFDLNNSTGIMAVGDGTDNNDVIYNLQGQRVSNPERGIYIVNGKKVFIK